MWNLVKWYRWTGLQGRNWDADVEKKRMDIKGGKSRWGGGGMNWASGIDMYTLMCIKWITNKNLLYKKTNKIQKFKKNKKNPKKLWALIFGVCKCLYLCICLIFFFLLYIFHIFYNEQLLPICQNKKQNGEINMPLKASTCNFNYG